MFTLNTDGSVIKATGEASAGDCLRDGNGNLVDAFSINIGKCSITRAEITCVATGLERAWATGVRNVEIQTDSTCVIKLLSGDWTVKFIHVFREANFLVDYLTNKGHDLTMGIHTIDTTDRGVLCWAHYDLFRGLQTLVSDFELSFVLSFYNKL
ncbi:Putative ribonuclease H protein At1g65750 [Linum perenne]